jgi:alkaline phosphatase D
LVDHRYFRTGDKTEGSLLGPEQMKWLEQQLLSCKGPFIILSCGTMWSDYITPGKDSWGIHDPQGHERLFRFIEDNRIGGVLLTSGETATAPADSRSRGRPASSSTNSRQPASAGAAAR